jgi:hypothetical protein
VVTAIAKHVMRQIMGGEIDENALKVLRTAAVPPRALARLLWCSSSIEPFA